MWLAWLPGGAFTYDLFRAVSQACAPLVSSTFVRRLRMQCLSCPRREHAAEAAPDGVKKLDSALKQSRHSGSAAVIRILTTRQLDLALGRPNVIHAALLAGRASETFTARLRRLERFRSGEIGDAAAIDEAGPGQVNVQG